MAVRHKCQSHAGLRPRTILAQSPILARPEYKGYPAAASRLTMANSHRKTQPVRAEPRWRRRSRIAMVAATRLATDPPAEMASTAGFGNEW